MKRIAGFTIVELIVVLAIISALLICLGFTIPLEFIFYALFGWAVFLWKTIPQASVEPAAIAVGAGALAAMIVLLHSFSRRMHRRLHGEQSSYRPWRFRWSLSIVFLVISLFSAGICALVLIHETGWLIT
jgi:prepilin-type N-terminal cleavage/methylation domain-containing protein